MSSPNVAPVFPASGNNSGIQVITANTSLDGTGSNVYTVFTAGANGARIDEIDFTHMGTNAATVIRLFINNGGSHTTATNNYLWKEITMAANVISQTAASVPVTLYAALELAPNYVLLATTGTTIAAGIMVLANGGNN